MNSSPAYSKHVDSGPVRMYIASCYVCVFLSVVLSRYFSIFAIVPLTCLYACGLGESASKQQFLTVLSIVVTRILSLIANK